MSTRHATVVDTHFNILRAAAIGVALFLIYNVSVRKNLLPDTLVPDTLTTEYVALNVAARGVLAVGDGFPLRKHGLASGYLQERGGELRSNYPLVPALLAAPAYWIGIHAGLINPADPPLRRVRIVGKLAGSGFTAAACAFLYLWIRASMPPAPAALAAVATGLTTPLWSSPSQALWGHGPGAVFLAVALLLVAAPRGEQAGARFAAGMAFGLAAACRPLLIFFAMGAAVSVGRLRWRRAIPLVTGCGLVLAVVAFYNVRIYGSPIGGQVMLESAEVHLRTHGVNGAWAGSLIPGMAGIMMSPSRGLIVFVPAVLFSLAGAWRSWHESQLLRWQIVIPCLLFLLTWAKYSVWWCGYSYGPRYAADIAIPLAILACAGLYSPGAQPSQFSIRAILPATLLWGLVVQGIGALVYPAGWWNEGPLSVDLAHERLWDWHDPQIIRTLNAGIHRLQSSPDDRR